MQRNSWEIIKMPGYPVLYHLNCHLTKSEHHDPDVTVKLKEGKYQVSMPGRTAGAAFFMDNWSLEQVNEFLKKLGYPELSQ